MLTSIGSEIMIVPRFAILGTVSLRHLEAGDQRANRHDDVELGDRAVGAGNEREGAQPEHGRALIQQPDRVENGGVCGEHPAARDQPHRPLFHARGARKEDLQIFESLSVGESEGAAHLLLNYNP